jgi:hypothetical protein
MIRVPIIGVPQAPILKAPIIQQGMSLTARIPAPWYNRSFHPITIFGIPASGQGTSISAMVSTWKVITLIVIRRRSSGPALGISDMERPATGLIPEMGRLLVGDLFLYTGQSYAPLQVADPHVDLAADGFAVPVGDDF